jgi:FkbM family methyltransferase
MAFRDKLLRAIRQELYARGLCTKKRFRVGGRAFTYTDLSRSNLLLGLALDGFDSYESELVTLLAAYPWPLDLFVDAGANVGFFSFYVSLARGWNVVAVEPFPDNAAFIRKHQALNGVAFPLVEKALDAVGGATKTLYIPTGAHSSALSASASLVNSFSGTGGVFDHLPYREAAVATATLPEVAGEGDLRRLIKLDCEGNELAILRASDALLRQDGNDFTVEIMVNDADKQDVHALLRDYGYHGYLITNAGLVREDRPLTLPNPRVKNRTLWKNHFYSKRDPEDIRRFSLENYGYWI